VPYTRGKERSRYPEAIIKEVKQLALDGYVEVTLLGQNVNAYGKDLKDINYTFADLLRDLNKLPIKRIRYTTSHPRDLDDATIDAMALGGNIMPHLHLPVQSGNNRVLKAMNRKYTREDYLDKIKKLKEKVPGISITTDIIVAFPGETEEEFNETLTLVDEVGYEGAYTFIYSPREGTPAAKYENLLTEEQKHDRLNRLNARINEGFLQGRKRFENEIVEVLVDGPSKNNPNMMTGYTPHNMLVNFEAPDALVGDLVNVKIIKAYSWHLLGELVK
jgi:tRNA-2-methylthio-N6-dimethylallyladenosine synthase